MKRVSEAAAPDTPPPYLPREASLLACGIQLEKRKYNAHKKVSFKKTQKEVKNIKKITN